MICFCVKIINLPCISIYLFYSFETLSVTGMIEGEIYPSLKNYQNYVQINQNGDLEFYRLFLIVTPLTPLYFFHHLCNVERQKPETMRLIK